MNSHTSLTWLNFFIADVRDGLGPHLGVFLQHHNFDPAQIGLIGTIASLFALIFGVPLGVFVDKTPYKRQLIGLSIIAIVISSLAIYIYPSFVCILLTQIITALCGVFLAPAFAAITLGIVGNKHYAIQVSSNEAFKHAGTAFGAIISFCFALYYGIASIFVITALMGGFSLIFLYKIKESSINHKIACGLSEKGEKISIRKVFCDKYILLMSFVMFCFHLSNASMLPLLSQRAFDLDVDSSGAFAAATIIIAQGTMIVIALFCKKILKENTEFKIYFYLLALSLAGLVIRGIMAAYFDGILGMIMVQILDGVGAGVTGVIIPILLAMILKGSGHINAGFAFVMTSGGIGGALSTAFAGFIVKHYGYFYAYATLALVAFFALLVWMFCFKFNQSFSD